MAGVDDLVVYIQTAVFYSSLHIHNQIVHTSHFPILSRPKPGGGVYLWDPNDIADKPGIPRRPNMAFQVCCFRALRLTTPAYD